MKVYRPECFVILLNIQIPKAHFAYFIKCINVVRTRVGTIRSQCVGVRRVDFCGDDLATDGSQINGSSITFGRHNPL